MSTENPTMQPVPERPTSLVPYPDPTERSREDLLREIKAVRELMETEMHALSDVNRQRMSAIEEAIPAIYAYYDRLLLERDQRYHERSTAAEDAVRTAFVSSEKAIASAFEAAEKAISKAEVSIEKRADATYVALNELQRMLSNLMPRVEGDQRFKTVEERTSELGTRVDRIEAAKAGAKEDRSGLYAGLAALGGLIGIGGFIFAAVK